MLRSRGSNSAGPLSVSKKPLFRRPQAAEERLQPQRSLLAASLLFNRGLLPGDVLLGGAGEELPLAVEPGAVAGAVPGLLGGVPRQLAAQVGTAGGDGVELAVLIPVGPRFFSIQAHDAAAAGGELVRLCGGEVEEALCQTFHSVASLRRDPRQGPAGP